MATATRRARPVTPGGAVVVAEPQRTLDAALPVVPWTADRFALCGCEHVRADHAGPARDGRCRCYGCGCTWYGPANAQEG
jgi:hypothetical protein